MSDNTTHPVHTPEDCPTYHDGCNCRERIATLETRVEVEVELRKASYERITELEAGLLRALHVINVFGKCSHSMQTWLHIPASCEFSHGPDDDLTIDEWLTDD